ncbi:hypothetical protein CEXT_392421 [Caerostris extrusa]|uniref:Secreted protein n=1 Tax=Caerostris extrusa TaxID=172846 RepID=A0AAV4MS54_CAEEX|nr:hypothetical protein CEXT_392421 [Caerostris extrusa]
MLAFPSRFRANMRIFCIILTSWHCSILPLHISPSHSSHTPGCYTTRHPPRYTRQLIESMLLLLPCLICFSASSSKGTQFVSLRILVDFSIWTTSCYGQTKMMSQPTTFGAG